MLRDLALSGRIAKLLAGDLDSEKKSRLQRLWDTEGSESGYDVAQGMDVNPG